MHKNIIMEKPTIRATLANLEAEIDNRFNYHKSKFMNCIQKKLEDDVKSNTDQGVSTKACERLTDEVDRVFNLDVHSAFEHLIRYFELFHPGKHSTRSTQPSSTGIATPDKHESESQKFLGQFSPTNKSQPEKSINLFSGQTFVKNPYISSESDKVFSLSKNIDKAKKGGYDLNSEDPLQKYMMEATQMYSFEKKFIMAKKQTTSDLIKELRRGSSSSASESEDTNNYLNYNQDSTYFRQVEDFSVNESTLSVSASKQIELGEPYTVTVIQTFQGEGQSLLELIKEFLPTLNPKNCQGSIELISNQRTDDWITQRKLRVTASNFGVFFKRRSFDPPENLHKLINCMMNPKAYGKIPALEYGKDSEAIARDDYIKKTGNEVEETGFWIRCEYPWLGGSPDGIVIDKNTGKKGLLEIKCPYSARYLTIREYIIEKKNAYLKDMDGKIYLDKSHNYYYQMQGCLFVCNMDWCDFVVRTEKDIFIERVVRNNEFIGMMLARLAEFYTRFLLPSLATGSFKENPVEYKMLSKTAYEKEGKKLIRHPN